MSLSVSYDPHIPLQIHYNMDVAWTFEFIKLACGQWLRSRALRFFRWKKHQIMVLWLRSRRYLRISFRVEQCSHTIRRSLDSETSWWWWRSRVSHTLESSHSSLHFLQTSGVWSTNSWNRNVHVVLRKSIFGDLYKSRTSTRVKKQAVGLWYEVALDA